MLKAEARVSNKEASIVSSGLYLLDLDTGKIAASGNKPQLLKQMKTLNQNRRHVCLYNSGPGRKAGDKVDDNLDHLRTVFKWERP